MDMRQLWERIKCAFLLGPRSRGSLAEPVATVRWPTLVGLNAVAVAVAALALAGASGARSGPGPVSARPLSGAPALKQAEAAGIDIGAVIATVRQRVDPVPGTAAPEDQLKPSIAFDGTNYLVVWQDGRSDGPPADNGYEIYGARVSQAGTVLDPVGIAISTATSSQYAPSVAFGGTNFLVAWEDYRSDGHVLSDIYGARVSQAGSVLDPNGIPISTASNHQQAPNVAADGTNFLVVWQDCRTCPGSNSYDIYGARVDPEDGTVLDLGGIPISTPATNDRVAPSVAFDGTNYLVVWRGWSASQYAISAARVSPAGVVLGPGEFPIETMGVSQYGAPTVAFDGTNYLVAWVHFPGVSNDIYGARVNQDGIVLAPGEFPISTAQGAEGTPSVAFDGT